jgi:hypothetical protein
MTVVKDKVRHILLELKGHSPFTLFGAVFGIIFMLMFRNLSQSSSHKLFVLFHPAHVVLSAIVTASMFKLHTAKKRFILVLLVGYFGSIGLATLSDIIIPHIGLTILGLDIPTHAETHHVLVEREDEHAGSNEDHRDGRHIHLGFIEEWYIVNPAAILGILIAYFAPRTKFPHAAHILVSTWASSAYLLMTMEAGRFVAAIVGIFLTLFLAVWLPCCTSDIIFPLLFVKSDVRLQVPCPVHARHSHPHEHNERPARHSKSDGGEDKQ